MKKASCGVIYLVPVPIGNLGDITLRALEVLKSASLIACEDTRNTAFLLGNYSIHVPKLVSFHKFNEKQRENMLFDHVESGKDLVVVSDAGSPAISDPAEMLVQVAIQKGINVIALPGATACIPAISISGFSTRQFQFVGFLPSDKARRKSKIREISEYQYPSIIYESPHRLLECLSELHEACGDRSISIIREISKLHEEHIYTSLGQASGNDEITLRGEFCIVLQGCSASESDVHISEADINLHIAQCFKKAMGTKAISIELSEAFGLSRGEAYDKVVQYLKKRNRK